MSGCAFWPDFQSHPDRRRLDSESGGGDKYALDSRDASIDALANWFNSLSGSGQDLIKVVRLVLGCWGFLSTGFMITPLGRITALAAALLLLWDDYQTWKEGGRSLIDWSRWEPAINAALDALKKLCDWLGKGAEAIGGWKTVAEVVL